MGPNRRQSQYKFVILAALLATTSLLVAPSLPKVDFIEYWAAARLFLLHANPYDPIAMMAMERSVGWSDPIPLMFLSPPWTLPLIAPLGWLSYTTAHVVWFALSALALFSGAAILWRHYGAPDTPDWLPLVTTAAFVPNLEVLGIGQTAAWILLGLAAFLYFARRGRDTLAGASLLALGIKPHLVYLAAIAVAISILRERKWKMLMSAAALYGALTIVAFAVAHGSIAGYRGAAEESMRWAPGFGGALRRLFGPQHYWMQFAPIFPGLLWFAWFWRRNQRATWEQLMPGLVLASVAMSAYGWPHDQAVFTVAIAPTFLLLRRATPSHRIAWLAAFVAMDLIIVLGHSLKWNQSYFVWTPLAWASLYWLATRMGDVAAPLRADAAHVQT
jgi:Glycosyltransferase family 87